MAWHSLLAIYRRSALHVWRQTPSKPRQSSFDNSYNTGVRSIPCKVIEGCRDYYCCIRHMTEQGSSGENLKKSGHDKNHTQRRQTINFKYVMSCYATTWLRLTFCLPTALRHIKPRVSRYFLLCQVIRDFAHVDSSPGFLLFFKFDRMMQDIQTTWAKHHSIKESYIISSSLVWETIQLCLIMACFQFVWINCSREILKKFQFSTAGSK